MTALIKHHTLTCNPKYFKLHQIIANKANNGDYEDYLSYTKDCRNQGISTVNEGVFNDHLMSTLK